MTFTVISGNFWMIKNWGICFNIVFKNTGVQITKVNVHFYSSQFFMWMETVQ